MLPTSALMYFAAATLCVAIALYLLGIVRRQPSAQSDDLSAARGCGVALFLSALFIAGIVCVCLGIFALRPAPETQPVADITRDYEPVAVYLDNGVYRIMLKRRGEPSLPVSGGIALSGPITLQQQDDLPITRN